MPNCPHPAFGTPLPSLGEGLGFDGSSEPFGATLSGALAELLRLWRELSLRLAFASSGSAELTVEASGREELWPKGRTLSGSALRGFRERQPNGDPQGNPDSPEARRGEG